MRNTKSKPKQNKKTKQKKPKQNQKNNCRSLLFLAVTCH